MDEPLPSYEAAVTKDSWPIIAPYIPSNDLCVATLVCRRWHGIFAPQLWGSPASHFDTESEMVYASLTRFKRALTWTRLSVRDLTHTLHLPPAHAEAYGLHSDWLRDVLECLPNLQSLIVSGASLLDHAALLTLRYAKANQALQARQFPTYGLRLLDASRCWKASAIGLKEALAHLPSLLYVDLSRTAVANDRAVISALKKLRNLRVLKLQDLNLNDEHAFLLASSIGSKVRSLDISGNRITIKGFSYLISNCFARTPAAGTENPDELLLRGRGRISDHFNERLKKKLADGLVFYNILGGTDNDVGITELYVSGNNLTIESISGLLRTGRLQVFDVALLEKSTDLPLFSPHPSISAEKPTLCDELIGILKEESSKGLHYLRINHSIVTTAVSSDGLGSNNPFLPTITPRSPLMLPSTLPALRTLVLTNLPTYTRTPDVSTNLILFISLCAEEAKSAKLQARSTYALPPGRNRVVAEREYASSLFALKKLILEMADPAPADAVRISSTAGKATMRASFGSGGEAGSGWRHTSHTSSMEDPDADAFWKASEKDFSFFNTEGEEDEEFSFTEGRSRPLLPPRPGTQGRSQQRQQTAGSTKHNAPTKEVTRVYDTIAELAKFRTAKKNEYLDALAKKGSLAIEDIPKGYWEGVITIVRNP